MSMTFFLTFGGFVAVMCGGFGYLVGHSDGKNESEGELALQKSNAAIANETARQLREQLLHAEDALVDARKKLAMRGAA